MFFSIVVTVSLASGWSCDQEDRRIAQHLEGVLAQLETSPPAGLSTQQTEARHEALAVLRRYVEAGRFPRWGGAGFVPVFVDESGTRCAMGEVLFHAGGAALVKRVHSTANEARIDQLADDAELRARLDAIGFTLEEAALVQPQYRWCGAYRALDVCGTARDFSRFTPFVVTARVDGGVPVVEAVLRGTPTPFELWPRVERDGGEVPWPDGTRVMAAVFRNIPDQLMVERDGRWSAPYDHLCGAPPMLSDAEARRVMFLPLPECLKALAALDGRWLVTTCHAWVSAQRPGDLVNGEAACRPDGSFRTEAIQPRGVFEEWLQRNQLEVDPAAYDVNLPVREQPALQTESLPGASPGCITTPGSAAVIALLLLARRRR